ncbi:hypothetical protein H257_15055 [Aphanomyces astaci]|uniref:RxLR effector protein n=1 Tax=Aphanomyces astaci TaxID=112090 RepID=W4FQK5_APHAT|nr:hypothetical protein H257_15055 [Aphanomyces astaci]ETV69236.1 hypothetical protein H257_15055 [Aphanomyces astaci]|eukprot:XP_009841338.1 hypothetical protein H257_15055 [Aphanomyces astaci]
MKTIALLIVSAVVAASDVTNVAAVPQGVVSDVKESQHLREGKPTDAQKKEWGLWGLGRWGLGADWGCGSLGLGLGCGGGCF